MSGIKISGYKGLWVVFKRHPKGLFVRKLSEKVLTIYFI